MAISINVGNIDCLEFSNFIYEMVLLDISLLGRSFTLLGTSLLIGRRVVWIWLLYQMVGGSCGGKRLNGICQEMCMIIVLSFLDIPINYGIKGLSILIIIGFFILVSVRWCLVVSLVPSSLFWIFFLKDKLKSLKGTLKTWNHSFGKPWFPDYFLKG